ncbi:MAG TPA: porin [Kiritimatiellia bacterium]|nr:porin [Kiritimatiellia bacterium]
MKSHLIARLGLASLLGLAALPAHANYDKLLSTLENNNTITAEQAAELRASAPNYTVRPSSSVIKDLQIRGRIQLQAAYVEADNDEGSDDYSTLEARRVRLGLRGTLFDNVRAQLEANLVPGSDLSMRSAFLQWREYKPAYIKVGYDKPHLSIEENTSSAEILTVERSMINNLLATGPMNGISLDGHLDLLFYGLGIYTDTDNRNKSGSDAKYLYNALLGLDLASLVGKGNTLRLQAVYTESRDDNGKFGGKFDDALTFGAIAGTGGFQVVGEYMIADNDGDETKGWYIMPSYFLTDKLQAVAKYEQAETDNARGIRAASRYARDVPSLAVRETDNADGSTSKFDPQRGSDYTALYLGLNYYLSGHAHKLMLGVELAELKGTDAGKLETTTVTTAWRMLF